VRTSIGKFEPLILPQGERLLWQGQPTARAFALRVFHLRHVAAYFALLFVGRVATGMLDHQPLRDLLASASRVFIPATIALIILGGLAVLYSRTTRYSVTNRRVLLQFGAVLPMTLNAPLAQVASAGLKLYPDQSGDMPLSLITEKRLSFLLLWPHVRPWRLNRVEPMLRCVPEAHAVADVLAQALVAASSPAPGPVAASMPVPRRTAIASAVASAA
jgi:Bacterial PH domain